MNLGCFCVVFLDVLIFFPFVPNTVEDGLFVWHVVKDASLLRQSACHGRCSGCRKNSVGRKSPPGLHGRVDAHDSLGPDREYRRA
jgi:hypothetical protein